MVKKNINIQLKKLIGNYLISRMSVRLIKRRILKRINSQKKSNLIVELDFINVKFASMCSTDELRNLERSLLKSKVRLAFINMGKEVKNMFRIVDKHRLEPEVKRPKFKIKVKNLKSLTYQF